MSESKDVRHNGQRLKKLFLRIYKVDLTASEGFKIVVEDYRKKE